MAKKKIDKELNALRLLPERLYQFLRMKPFILCSD